MWPFEEGICFKKFVWILGSLESRCFIWIDAVQNHYYYLQYRGCGMDLSVSTATLLSCRDGSDLGLQIGLNGPKI